MDCNDDITRQELSGSKGLDLVNGCNSDSEYNINITLLTNALLKEDENNNDIRNGLAENICRLIIRQSNLSPANTTKSITAQKEEDDTNLIKANSLINQVVSIISTNNDNNNVDEKETIISSNFIECFFNVSRKPNMANNYCLYIPSLTIIYYVMSQHSMHDVLELSRMSHNSFAEDEWHTNLIYTLPKKLFSLPTGLRPTSVSTLKLLKLGLLLKLKDSDFHSGFGKVIPLQLSRFTKDTFDTLGNLCYVLRCSSNTDNNNAKLIKALEFHFSQGMKFSIHIMKHLSNKNATTPNATSSAVKICNEYIYLNPTNTLEMVTNVLSQISDNQKNECFYQSLIDIANAVYNDNDKNSLPHDKLSNGVNNVVKSITSLMNAGDSSVYDLLQEALDAWERLKSSSAAAAMKPAAAVGVAAIASKPGAVSSSSYDSKIQQKIATDNTASSAMKPGVYAAASSSSSPESRKIKIDQQQSKPGSVISESYDSNIARKISSSSDATSSNKPGVIQESQNDAINRKISTSSVDITASNKPGVEQRSNDTATNRKILLATGAPAGVTAATSRPGAVTDNTNAADNAIRRKIQTDGGGMGASKPIVESRNDDAINRKIQSNDNAAQHHVQTGIVVQSVSNEIDNSINRKISQNNTPVYESNEPVMKDNNYDANDPSKKSKIDMDMSNSNKSKMMLANEDVMHHSDKQDKLINETCYDEQYGTANEYQTELEQIANAQEFRHKLNREQKDKKKKKNENKQKKELESGWDSEQNLAVAVAIEEEDDEQYFDDYDPIFAEEYDANYKPKIYKNPRVMSRVLCCFVIIIVCVTGVIITFTKQAVYKPEPTFAPTESPTQSPTSYRDTLDIDTFITTYFNYNFTSTIDGRRIQDVSIYEYNRRLAINWIINGDPLKLTLKDDNGNNINHNILLQRYIIILLYLSTNGDHWKACNGNDGYDDYLDHNDTYYNDDYYYDETTDTTTEEQEDGNGEEERTIDRRIRRWLRQKQRSRLDQSDGVNNIEDLSMECTYTDYLGFNYTDTRWLSSTNECSWFGIMCNNDNEIQQLLLQDNGLQGTIPWEIAKLPYLYRFWVNANSINGAIPNEIGTMSHLADLQLHSNAMTGTIPESLFDVSTLQALNLAINEFTGTISSKFSKLSNLKGLYLFENHFTGTIPKEIGDLSYLVFTWLHDNMLEGPIPTTIGKLSKLLQFKISYNQMDGKIPKEVASAHNLEALLLENNKFTGTIPEEIYTLTNMKTLFLHSNEFSGTISNDISNFALAEKLIFRGNKFDGTIPKSIGKLDNLDNLWFQFNKFTGKVPDKICTMFEKKKTEWVLYADCDDTMGNAAVECECCTDCCDNVQKLCYQQ